MIAVARHLFPYAACAGVLLSLSASAAVANTITLVIDKLQFPPVPPVKAGDTLVLVNRDIFRHSVTAADASFDVELPPGAKARLTVGKRGTTVFTCKYHPNMRGSIVVSSR